MYHWRLRKKKPRSEKYPVRIKRFLEKGVKCLSHVLICMLFKQNNASGNLNKEEMATKISIRKTHGIMKFGY